MPPDEPPRPEITDAFDRAITAFTAAQARYALIGGFAVAHHGLPRPTRDIDFIILVPRIRLPGLLDRFHESGFTFSMEQVIRELGESHMSMIRFGAVRVDLLDAVVPIFRRTVENALETEVQGRKVMIARAEELIALKLIASRETDLRDIRGMLAARAGTLHLDAVRRNLDDCCDDSRRETFERLVKETGQADNSLPMK
jgi:predicted nucleotidyltransferase